MNTSSLSSHSYMGANNGYASPYSDRLYSPSSRGYLSPVGSKLDQIQPSSYYERNDEISDFERKIRVLDARVTVDSDLAKEKLKAGADQIGRLEQQMYNNTVLTNELNDKLTEDMKELQNGASMEVKIEEQTQKAVHQKMLKNFENKIANIKGEVGDSLRKARENMKTGRENIAKKVESLHEEIEKEKRIRQEENEKLINSISSRLNKVQEGLQRDRKLRQETQDMLLRSLEEMNKKLVLQVKIENENREKGEDQMIRLLELACNNFVPQRNEANTSIVGGLGLGLGLGLNGSFTSETKRVLMSNSQLY